MCNVGRHLFWCTARIQYAFLSHPSQEDGNILERMKREAMDVLNKELWDRLNTNVLKEWK